MLTFSALSHAYTPVELGLWTLTHVCNRNIIICLFTIKKRSCSPQMGCDSNPRVRSSDRLPASEEEEWNRLKCYLSWGSSLRLTALGMLLLLMLAWLFCFGCSFPFSPCDLTQDARSLTLFQDNNGALAESKDSNSTPSGTPTQNRKNRRRSNLFTVSQGCALTPHKAVPGVLFFFLIFFSVFFFPFFILTSFLPCWMELTFCFVHFSKLVPLLRLSQL